METNTDKHWHVLRPVEPNMADLKDQSSVAAADYYQVIVDNVKLGMTHGFAVGILILVGLGIKIKFFGAKNKQKNKVICNFLRV